MTAETPLTLQRAAQLLYAKLTDAAIEEASGLDSVDPEIAMMRIWLRETVEMDERDKDLMKVLLDQIVRAVAVRYRLSPKRAGDLSSALTAVLYGIGSQIGMVEQEV